MSSSAVKHLTGVYKNCMFLRIDFCHYCNDGSNHFYGGYEGCWGDYDETDHDCCEECGMHCPTCTKFFHMGDMNCPDDYMEECTLCKEARPPNCDCERPAAEGRDGYCYKCAPCECGECEVVGGSCEKAQESSEAKVECPPTTSSTKNTA